MNKAKYAFLLFDEDVKRWYRNLVRGSKVTADVSLRRLGLFCLEKGIMPKQLIELGKEKATRLILDTIDEFEAKGYSNSYIKNMLKAVKSWLKFNNMALTVEVKINDAEDTPTQEELSRIFRACKLDARAAIALMAFSGLRPQVLGNYDGRGGLRLSDFLEAKIDNEKKLMEFTRIPTFIKTHL
jgi:integrase